MRSLWLALAALLALGCTDPGTTISCPAGRAECDGDTYRLCETDLNSPRSCGACGNVCPNVAFATSPCVDGRCGAWRCFDGRADCDGTSFNGCEVDLTSPMSCGACGARCEPHDNAESTCGAGVCGFVCREGYADCDADAANGCETSVSSSITHCGACGNACSDGGACIDGVCHPPCSATYRDCVDDDGRCETDTLTSADHCGACGARCAGDLANGRRVCLAGTCGLACAPGFADCDGVATNGCEVELTANDAQCGACGHACVAGETCASGACAVARLRPWRPQSLSITTTRRPTFTWHLRAGFDGARLEVCADRACDRVEHTADVAGESYRPPASVVFSEGVHYWRLWGRIGGRLATAHGPTWLFRAPASDAGYDTAWRLIQDFDGDGVEDATTSGLGVRLSTTGALWLPRAATVIHDYSDDYENAWHQPSFSTRFAGDLDGDGYGDLVGVERDHVILETGHYTVDYRVVFCGGGLHDVAAPPWVPLNATVYRNGEDFGDAQHPALSLAVGDIDGDGLADLAGHRESNDPRPGDLRGVLWASAESYRERELGNLAPFPGGDFDGDGFTEMVLVQLDCVASTSDACVSPYPRASARLSLANGCAAVSGGWNPSAWADDANADGLADMVLSYPSTVERPPRTVRFLGGPGGLTGDRCELVP